jgi:hypothetical protein
MSSFLHRWRFWLLRKLNAVHKPYYDELLDAYVDAFQPVSGNVSGGVGPRIPNAGCGKDGGL